MAIGFGVEKEKNIKYGVSLNEEQKEAKSKILDNKISYIIGRSGAGKTLLSTQIALDQYFKGKVKKIIITRPTVTAGENLGYLPGGIEEKMDPFLQAIYQNFYALYNKKKIDQLLEEGVIQIVPFAFMRGITYTDAIVILDEGQNMTVPQCKMALERLGVGSKLLICGDIKQKDLNKSIASGIEFLEYINDSCVPGFVKIELLVNHRDPLVDDILDIYDSFEAKQDVEEVKKRISEKYS